MALPTRVQRGQTDPMEQVNREFEGFFNRMLGRDIDGGQFAPYGVDVREDADHIYVEAELPGFRKEDVDITLENQTLTITAQRTEQAAEGDGNGGQQPGQTAQAGKARGAGQQSPRPGGEWLLRERRYTR